jgi:hypothetical protein
MRYVIISCLALAMLAVLGCQGEETEVIINGTPVKVSLPTATVIAQKTAAAVAKAATGEAVRVFAVVGRDSCTVSPRTWTGAAIMRWGFVPDRGPASTKGNNTYYVDREAAFKLIRKNPDNSIDVIFEYAKGDPGSAGHVKLDPTTTKYVFSGSHGTWSYTMLPAEGVPILETPANRQLLDDERLTDAQRRFCSLGIDT